MCNAACGIALNFVRDVTHPIRQTAALTTGAMQQEGEADAQNTHNAMLLAIYFCWFVITH